MHAADGQLDAASGWGASGLAVLERNWTWRRAGTAPYRACMFSKIMYVTLFVADQERALAFYTTMFGFEKRADYAGPEGRFLTMAFKEQAFEVLLWPGSAGQASVEHGAPSSSAPGPLILQSDDLKADYALLRERGVRFADGEPESYPFGVRVTALDPDGNRISLRQRR